LILGAGCAGTPTAPPTPPAVIGTDDFPRWLDNGRDIIFHRRFPSTIGPAGIYVVSRNGGTPRLVYQGNFSGPRDLSPDPTGKFFVAEQAFQLLIVNMESGEAWNPMYTDNWALMPDWSPSGEAIVYYRGVRQHNEPLDSVGVHIYSLASGTTAPIKANGQVIGGQWPRWSPDGQLIACAVGSPPRQIVVVRPDGSDYRVVATAAGSDFIQSLRWGGRPTRPFLAFVEGAGRARTSYEVDVSTGERRRLGFRLGPWDEYSPDGETIVQVLPRQPDGLGVLFLRSAADPTGASLVQLTNWEF
jgi:dipeptidyl aminopeptidase/acylaminoacyl peptidase